MLNEGVGVAPGGVVSGIFWGGKRRVKTEREILQFISGHLI